MMHIFLEMIRRCVKTWPVLGLCAISHGALAQSTLRLELPDLDDALANNVRAFMTLDEEACDAPRWRIERQLRRLGQTVQNALEPLGHFNARIQAQRLETVEDCWQLRVRIDPGPLTHIRAVNVSLSGAGQNAEALQPALARIRALQDQPYRADVYRAARQNLAVLAHDEGFLRAAYTVKSVRVHSASQRAEVHLVFDTGAQHTVGAVQITQNSEKKGLDADFIHNMLPDLSGRMARSATLTQVRSDLLSSGYFARVQARYRIDEAADGAVPLQITVTPVPHYVYSAGFGYATDSGPRATLSYKNNRMNNSGRQISAALELSSIRYQFTTALRLPDAEEPLQRWRQLEAGLQHESSDSVDSDAFKIGFAWHRKRPAGWQNNWFVDALLERFTFADEREQSVLLLPGSVWQKTVSEGVAYPLGGHHLSLEAKFAAEALLSDTSLASLHLQGKKIWPLGQRSRLLLRGELGALWSRDFDRTPASLRFFAGGDDSIRGYDYKAIGSRNADGEIIGGEYLFTGSLEIDRRITERWGAALFVDAGDAFSDAFDVKRGVGVGLRWFSPVGPIRLDLAHPLDADDAFRVHISLGADL